MFVFAKHFQMLLVAIYYELCRAWKDENAFSFQTMVPTLSYYIYSFICSNNRHAAIVYNHFSPMMLNVKIK